MTDSLATRPVVTLLPQRHKRAESGHPWIYSNEVSLDEAAKTIPAGTPVTVLTSEGKRLGVAGFNPHTLVALRMLDRDPGRAIDEAFLASRLRRAQEIRQRLIGEPWYRLIHAEADGLPGTVIDRYGPAVVVQSNSALAAHIEPDLLGAIETVLKPSAILLRNDSGQRSTEGLASEVRLAKGEIAGPVEVRENGARYRADLVHGQKTGWFYDQRPNRAFIASLARGQRVLDVYAHSGGFGVLAAMQGARQVLLVDRADAALDLAMQSAAASEVADRVERRTGDAFETLDALAEARERFELVILDPPSFVKARKDLGAGTRAYRKLVRQGATVTARHGFLMIASCSHNMALEPLMEAAREGLGEAGRGARLLHTGFAGADHPVHPALPESAYLKALIYVLD